MKITGEHVFVSPRQKVWEALQDPQMLDLSQDFFDAHACHARARRMAAEAPRALDRGGRRQRRSPQ